MRTEPSIPKKLTIGVFIYHYPDLETLYHLLKHLNERGVLGLKIILSATFCRKEPRVRQLFDEVQLPYQVLPGKVIKYFYWGCFRGMDAVLGISDPIGNDLPREHKRRHRYLVSLNLPSIYFQHGIVQENVNFFGNPLGWRLQKEKTDFYSTKAFLMEYPASTQWQYFTDSALARIEICGFLKKPCFPPKSIPSSINSQLSKYDVRLLICHSLHGSNFANEDVESFYSIIEKFANVNPQIGVIVRPHRGRRKKSTKRTIEYSRKNVEMYISCTNVMVH